MLDNAAPSLDRRAFLSRGLVAAGGFIAAGTLAAPARAWSVVPPPGAPPGPVLPYPLGVAAVERDLAGLTQVEHTLARLRRIAIDAAQATHSELETARLDHEFQQQLAKLDLIAGGSEFLPGLFLLDGSTTVLMLGLPPPSARVVELDLLDCTATTLGISSTDVTSVPNAAAALAHIDAAVADVHQTLRETQAFARAYVNLD